MLVQQVTEALESYDVTGATRPIQAFVDDLSKWYLRRSRRRFWKSLADEDKDSAYRTLYEALVTLSKLLAPTMPFLAEALYQNLVRAVVEDAPESVHLADWPGYDPGQIDESAERRDAPGDAAGLAGACGPQPGRDQGAPAAGGGGFLGGQAGGSPGAGAARRSAGGRAERQASSVCCARRTRRFRTA